MLSSETAETNGGESTCFGGEEADLEVEDHHDENSKVNAGGERNENWNLAETLLDDEDAAFDLESPSPPQPVVSVSSENEDEACDVSDKCVEESSHRKKKESLQKQIHEKCCYDFYPPSKGTWALLFILTMGVTVGLGFGIYAARTKRIPGQNGSSSSMDINPTMAPTRSPLGSTQAPTGSRTREDAACNICPGGGSVSFPRGIVMELPRKPTCSELQAQADNGELSPGQCELVQILSLEPCGCIISNEGDKASCTTVCKNPNVVRDPEGMVDISDAGIPNVDIVTCGQLEVFVRQGRIPELSCPTITSASAKACDCGPPPICSMCPEGHLLTNFNGIIDSIDSLNVSSIAESINITCQEFQNLADEYGVPMDICPDLQALSFEPCGCTPMLPADFQCPICPNGQVIQDVNATVEFDGELLTCLELQTIGGTIQLDETQCSIGVQEAGRASCNCGPNPEQEEILQALEFLMGSSVREPGTFEFAAAEYFLYEDPRFRATGRYTAESSIVLRGRRDLQIDAKKPACIFCPSGQNMFNPEAIIPEGRLPENLSEYQGTNCAELMLAGIQGLIPADVCRALQTLTMDLCGGCVAPLPIAILDPPFDFSDPRMPIEPKPIDSPAPPSDELLASSDSIDPLDEFSSGFTHYSEIYRRYLMILLYYQTSNIGESPWKTGCDPSSSEPCEINGEEQEDGRWLSALGECSWAGVTCNVDNMITGLDLAGFGLTGEFPSAVIPIKSLIRLDLFDNSLQGPIPVLPNRFMHLRRLQYLNLNANELTGIIPENIHTTMPNLKVVNLGGNPGGNNLTGAIDCSSRANEAMRFGIDCESVSCNGDCCECCGLFHDCVKEEPENNAPVRLRI